MDCFGSLMIHRLSLQLNKKNYGQRQQMKAALLQKHAQALGLSPGLDADPLSRNSSRDQEDEPRELPSPSTTAQWTLAQVDLFQKAALYRQLLEYKRLYQDTNDAKQETERASLGLLESYSILFTSLKGFLSEPCPFPNVNDESVARDSETKGFMTPAEYKSLQSLVLGNPNPLSLAESDINQLKFLAQHFFSSVHLLLSSSSGSTSAPTDSQIKFLKSLESLQSLEAQVLRLNQEISMWHDRYQTLQHQERIAQRRWDRLQMTHNELLAKLKTTNGNTPAAAPAGPSLTSAQSNLAPQPPPVLKRGPSQPSTELNLDDPSIKNLYRDCQEAQHLAQQRSDRISSLEDERKQLALELEGIRAHYATHPKDSQAIATLERDLVAKDSEIRALREQNQSLLSETEKLTSERRSFVEKIQNEESVKRKAMESEHRKMESDLNRLRKQRETLQQTLDAKKAPNGSSKLIDPDTKALLQAQKERIHCLELDVQRLLGSLGKDTKDQALKDFLREKMGSQFEHPVEYYHKRTKELQAKVQELDEKLGFFEVASAELRERKEVLDRESKLKKELQDTQAKLSDFESRQLKESQELLASRDNEIASLKDQVALYTQTQTSLLSEIQALSQSWSTLEELNSKKIFERSEMEELKLKHKEEKVRMDHKCANLSKLAMAAENSQKAMAKQSAKQLELILKLQSLEKNLQDQLANRDMELSLKSTAYETEKKRVVELMDQIDSLKKQVEESGQKLNNVSTLLRSKTEALENEISLKKKLQDQVSTLKHKVELINKDGDIGLREQLDNYKLLLKCSSCNNRFKSHVLLKCMHVFCKECLDDLYNSRQRKCPSCSLAFGQHDIKQIYL